MAGIFKILAIMVGAVVGWFVMISSWTINIMCFGTAFIGAVLFFHGLGSFAGGFPNMAITSLDETDFDPIFLAYVCGIIFFTIGGGAIQKRRVVGNQDDYERDTAESAKN